MGRVMPYPKRDSSYAFIYDGTLEGLLCAIFETYRQKLVPSEIVTEENLQLAAAVLSAPLEWHSFPMSPIKVQQFVLSCATP